MRRREFITLLGGAVVTVPFTARAQQPAISTIGFLDGRFPEAIANRLRGFHRGLREAGYVEGENLTILYRYAENQSDRLPALAADLARRPVAVIVASGGPNVMSAAKQASATVPIVFIAGEDPVRAGLVSSLSRPEGNLTGVAFFTGQTGTKRMELLQQLVPHDGKIGVLLDANQSDVADQMRDAEAAVRGGSDAIEVVKVQGRRDFDGAFEQIAKAGSRAVLVGNSPFFTGQRQKIVALAASHALPASYTQREYTEAGGLMSYGPNVAAAFHQVGVYTARILKGEKPADLPVDQATRFEFVLNLKTAKALGLEIPPTLLALTDEVIE